ncbi:MAG: LacI family DNA-binding transcriptional regulator [Eubacteriales bacterium]|nr:LacI family DNA-binding transcriptional regulator [Eubacteriales bacterium]
MRKIKKQCEREITIRDIARICGVGVSTVSRAINNQPDINPETKQMILRAIKRYGYIPNTNARDLRKSDGKCVAVIVKGLYNPLLAEAIQIMEEEIKRRAYATVVRYVNFDENEASVALELSKREKLSGIIFLGGFFSDGDQRLKKIKVPFVLSTSECKLDEGAGKKYTTLSVDNEKESYRMTEYLIELGHRKIAVLSGIPDEASIGKLRLEGYKRALKDYGVQMDESLILPMKKESAFYSMENGYLMAKELLESGRKFTCLYAFSDAMAIGACRAIADVGRKIPDDYSVAGFDGIEIGNFYNPKLTTIRQPVHDIARESVDALMKLLEGEKTYIHRVFQGTLEKRESTKHYSVK